LFKRKRLIKGPGTPCFYFFLQNEVQQENFELKFRYSFLAPPVESNKFDETDAEGQSHEISNLLEIQYHKNIGEYALESCGQGIVEICLL